MLVLMLVYSFIIAIKKDKNINDNECNLQKGF